MKLKLLSTLAFSMLLQAETIQFTEYVKVKSSLPEYQSVREQVPYQECYDEQVPIAREAAPNNNVVGSVIGGAIGGVLGHQVGEGRGKDAATIGGAILGTIVGGNTLGDNGGYQQAPQYETRRRCVTKYRQGVSRREFIGYKNIGYYKGNKIVKYSNTKLKTIPVTVTIDY